MNIQPNILGVIHEMEAEAPIIETPVLLITFGLLQVVSYFGYQSLQFRLVCGPDRDRKDDTRLFEGSSDEATA